MTGAVGWLASRWLRRRGLGVMPLGLLVALGTAGAMVALGAAHRTSTAYDRYLDRAEVGDVVLNPSVSTLEIDEVIRTLPGVETVTSHSLFTVTGDGGAPRSREELDGGDSGGFAFVIGSSDGRFLETDRPAIHEGRMPTGPSEGALTVDAAAEAGLGIGDVVPLAFWQPGIPDGLNGVELERFVTEVIDPIGSEEIEVVGIVTLPDEVLPDELYPRAKLILSPDVAARYDCLPPTPRPGSRYRDYVDALLPVDCAASYRYYSLAFEDDGAGVKPALDVFLQISGEMNVGLTDISDLSELDVSEPPQYFLIPTETAQEAERVERAVRPTVTALGMLGVAVAIMTIGLAGLLTAREIRRSRRDLLQWHQLGVATGARAVVVGAPLAVAAGLGLVVGAVAAWLLDRGPVGLVRSIEPDPARRLTAVTLLALLAVGAAVLLLIALLSWRAARRPAMATARPSGGRRSILGFVGRTGSPVLTDGVRAAYGQRTTTPVLVGCAILTGGFVAASVFGASLSSLLSTPRSYGWPWDVAVVTGYGYGDLDLQMAQEVLDEHPDVESWTAMGFLNEVSLEGEPLMTALGLERLSSVDLPVVSGSLPDEKDEVALGATTAAERGLSVGDTVEIGGAFDPLTVEVSGIVVFPSLGPVLSDRVSTGTGLLLPQALFDNADLRYLAEDAVGLATFVGVDLREGTDPDVLAELQEQLGRLDQLGIPALQFPDPVRPPEIVDARSTRTVPALVGLAFAVTAALGLGFGSWASTRARRRDLSVLRALGFSGTQLRRSVVVQSLATMAVALAAGVPLGIVTGRLVWRAFAQQLGVVDDPASPLSVILLATAGGIVLALLVAQVPGRMAAAMTPTEGLRSE